MASISEYRRTWRGLTPSGRAALLKLTNHAHAAVHHSTRVALQRRGLLDERGRVTVTGARVVRHRPTQLPGQLGGRPVVDVHLPEGATA